VGDIKLIKAIHQPENYNLSRIIHSDDETVNKLLREYEDETLKYLSLAIISGNIIAVVSLLEYALDNGIPLNEEGNLYLDRYIEKLDEFLDLKRRRSVADNGELSKIKEYLIETNEKLKSAIYAIRASSKSFPEPGDDNFEHRFHKALYVRGPIQDTIFKSLDNRSNPKFLTEFFGTQNAVDLERRARTRNPTYFPGGSTRTERSRSPRSRFKTKKSKSKKSKKKKPTGK